MPDKIEDKPKMINLLGLQIGEKEKKILLYNKSADISLKKLEPYLEEDILQEDIEVEKVDNFNLFVQEYLSDPSVKNAVWVLNFIFIFGIIAMFIKLIITIRR